MTTPRTRREFLAEVGRGMLIATVGYQVASELELTSALAEETVDTLSFGSLEPLVCLMQETPVIASYPLVEQMRSGTDLRRLIAAAALANARTFGGEDYVGFHTMMALAPALHMASRTAHRTATAARLQGALSEYQPHSGAGRTQGGSAARGRTGKT